MSSVIVTPTDENRLCHSKYAVLAWMSSQDAAALVAALGSAVVDSAGQAVICEIGSQLSALELLGCQVVWGSVVFELSVDE